ncbi:helicase SNF2 [Variovorax paradoxus]|nr:helicase SNF2 [Variovorax paradoxus]
MTASILLATAALSSLFALSASAEQYQGVLQLHSSASRASVKAEAVVASHSADPYREGAPADVAAALPNEVARADARAEGVAAARAGNLYADGANADVPHAFTSTLDRSSVRAQARATAAHGVTEGTL